MAVDRAVASAVARIGLRPPPTDSGSCLPPRTPSVLRQIRLKGSRLEAVMGRIVDADKAGDFVNDQLVLRNEAEQLAIDLNQDAGELTNAATAEANELIAENASPTRPRGTCSSWSRPGRSCSP